MPVTNIPNIAAVSHNTDGRVARSGGQSGPDPEFATATHIAEFVLEKRAAAISTMIQNGFYPVPPAPHNLDF